MASVKLVEELLQVKKKEIQFVARSLYFVKNNVPTSHFWESVYVIVIMLETDGMVS